MRAINNNIYENKIATIHGGANTGYIKYHERINHRKSSEPKIVFGYIGMSDGEFPDLEPFIKAFVKCSEKMNIVFKTFGKRISIGNIRKYGLEKIIESGWVDYFKNPDALSSVDVYILIKKDNAINRAGWPNKLGDYMAAGRPVLLNPYGDLHEFAKKYPNGLIITAWNEIEIEDKISGIYNGKYDLDMMGKYNRQTAERELSWGRQSVMLEEFYKKILK